MSSNDRPPAYHPPNLVNDQNYPFQRLQYNSQQPRTTVLQRRQAAQRASTGFTQQPANIEYNYLHRGPSTSGQQSSHPLMQQNYTFRAQSTAAETPGRPQFSNEFLEVLNDYKGIIPLSVTKYYMNSAGLSGNNNDIVAKLISIATQKYISDILLDARERALLKLPVSIRNRNDNRLKLTPELLTEALKERGIEVIRPPYHE